MSFVNAPHLRRLTVPMTAAIPFRQGVVFASVLFALLGCAANMSAQTGDSPSIWGRTIAAQPFAKQAFREIRIPDWVQQTTGVGYTLSGQSTDKRERAVKAGVTISELVFVDPFYCYYDSKLLANKSPHVPLDHIDKDVAEYRRLGLRILAVYPPCLQSEVYAAHPEWRRIATNTTEVPQVDLKEHPHGGMLCLLGPYGDFLIDVLTEITKKYRVDAWSFDGLHYGGVCYCQHCREGFRKDAGMEIPEVDLNNADFRRYQHWADRRMEDLICRMQRRLKTIQPEVALVTWTTNAGRFGHLRDIPRNMPARMNLLLDAPDQEFWLDETNRGATIVPALANAYIWACTNHRVAFSEPYLMSHGNPYGKDSFPAHEVLRRVLLAATHGVGPSLAVGQPDSLQDAAYAALEEVKKRKPWLTHKQPEPWGAMLLSDNTRVFYGRSPAHVEERYLASVFGTFRAVLEEHLPVTTICDWNLTAEDLARYKVLVLPNTACLDERQMSAIREFVKNGGGLVASLDTSLCDEFGDVRTNFGLADMFGARYRGVIKPSAQSSEQIDANFAKGLDESFWEKRKNIFDLKINGSCLDSEEQLRKLVGRNPVLFKGSAVGVRSTEPGEVMATVAPRGAMSPTTSPAIVARDYGKGRVVYFPAGIDAAYYSYPLPYYRVLLARAMRWAAGNDPPVEVTAPMCVHATVFRQRKDGERLLIHLFNDVNTTAFHGLPNDDVPLREETIPIHDIEITLRGYKIGKAIQQPEGKELPVAKIEAGAQKLTVSRLDIHSIVVVELE
jgi:hypothetical protein